jgi:hypothetical protein
MQSCSSTYWGDTYGLSSVVVMNIFKVTGNNCTKVRWNKTVYHFLDRKTLEKIYLTFIRPILEYADVVWDNKTLFLINKLENVQIEAARNVTEGTRLVSFHNLTVEGRK